jgi:hypothetical protein
MSLVPYRVTAIKKTDPTGNNILPLASVAIVKSGGGYAQLWDDEAGTAVRANPFQVDSNGERQVWLNGGEYNVSVAGGQSWDIKLVGGSDILSIENVAALATYTPVVGQVYYLKEYHAGTGFGGSDVVGKIGSITPDNVTTFACAGLTYVERINVSTWTPRHAGAYGNGSNDDTVAIQRILDVPIATISAIDFSGGTWKLTGSTVNGACLNLTKNKSLIADKSRAAIFRADSAGPTTSILKIAINENNGLLDCRDLKIKGITMIQNGGGQHCILIKDTMTLIGAEISDCSFTASTAAGARDIYMDGDTGFCQILRNTISQGIVWGTPSNPAADGTKFIDTIGFGTKTSITLQILDGAYRTTISGGTLVSRDGQVRIISGSQVLIQNVQFEQDQAQGQSQSPEKAHIAILGTGQQCKGVTIRDCNLGGGTNCDYLVWVDNAIDTDIDANNMNAPAVADVYTSGNALYTVPRISNHVSGNISNPRPDGRFKMVVSDNGVGTYNVLKTHTSLANGWSNGQFYKNENDEVIIDTGFDGGTNSSGTIMATFPVGFRSASSVRVVGTTSTTNCICSTDSTGAFTLQTTGSNASVAAGARYASKRN